jgi:hypothetical protein
VEKIDFSKMKFFEKFLYSDVQHVEEAQKNPKITPGNLKS